MRYPTLLLGGTYSRMLSHDELRASISGLVRAVGMTPVDEPVVTCINHRWGPSVFQALEESHAIFHYFAPPHWFLDLFTCQEVSDGELGRWIGKVERELAERFSATVMERQVVWRTIARGAAVGT